MPMGEPLPIVLDSVYIEALQWHSYSISSVDTQPNSRSTSLK